MTMTTGKVVFLNGTSSAGKTTLAYALQELLDEPWQHIALDQFRDGLPAKYRGLNSPDGTTGSRGLNVVPVREQSQAYTVIRFGDAGKSMLAAMRRAIAVVAREGINVIIDDIILEESFLLDYLEVMQGLPLYFVGVRCPLDEINRREAQRPGRFPGTALGHFDLCHAHGSYDVEVDTSTQDPASCAALVARRLAAGPPCAFDNLRRHQASLATPRKV